MKTGDSAQVVPFASDSAYNIDPQQRERRWLQALNQAMSQASGPNCGVGFAAFCLDGLNRGKPG